MTDDWFGDLTDALATEPGVQPPTGARAFGGRALKVAGKIFAMQVDGELVVKLPAPRVAAAIAAGDGTPFTAGKQRAMREWLTVSAERPQLREPLAREALAFVGG